MQKEKERKIKMEAKKELLKQHWFKMREEDAFYKRLSSSVEHKLVSHRVQTSLSSSLESDRSAKERKYRIEFDRLPTKDVIKLMPKPRPRDIYKPPSSLKLLERKSRKFTRFQTQTFTNRNNYYASGASSMPILEEVDRNVLSPLEELLPKKIDQEAESLSRSSSTKDVTTELKDTMKMCSQNF